PTPPRSGEVGLMVGAALVASGEHGRTGLRFWSGDGYEMVTSAPISGSPLPEGEGLGEGSRFPKRRMSPMKIASSRRTSRRGFTLIEMLTVIAILGILIGLLFIPLTASFRFVGREERDIKLQNVTREALRLVTGTLA